LSFRKIGNFDDLEKGSFNIMEPKEDCPESKQIDVVLAPSIGITRKGIRLGYGYGYFDRFLASSKASTIALNYSKQIVKSIPFSENDIKIDWVVTEEEFFKT
jgi:5-formyltetrahydrofolate cyclo-ligase